MDAVQARWKDFKSRVKKDYFEPYKDNDELLLSCPDARVENSQWQTLVQYWKDENVKVAFSLSIYTYIYLFTFTGH